MCVIETIQSKGRHTHRLELSRLKPYMYIVNFFNPKNFTFVPFLFTELLQWCCVNPSLEQRIASLQQTSTVTLIFDFEQFRQAQLHVTSMIVTIMKTHRNDSRK